MDSDFTGPVNIGSDEMISIDNLAYMVMRVAGKYHPVNHVAGPLGVRGRNSDNRLIRTTLGWAPSQPLETGIKATYEWIARQLKSPVLETECPVPAPEVAAILQ
jgi:nucleoside-diphosphate-sugar epimerase